MVLVVVLDEIQDDRVRLPVQTKVRSMPNDVRQCAHVPKDEVTIVVIDQGGDTAVGVVLSVLIALDVAELEVTRLVGKTELVEYEADLPVHT